MCKTVLLLLLFYVQFYQCAVVLNNSTSGNYSVSKSIKSDLQTVSLLLSPFATPPVIFFDLRHEYARFQAVLPALELIPKMIFEYNSESSNVTSFYNLTLAVFEFNVSCATSETLCNVTAVSDDGVISILVQINEFGNASNVISDVFSVDIRIDWFNNSEFTRFQF